MIERIPAPMQQPYPPLLIAGGGKQTLDLVAAYADGCNLAGPWGAVTPGDVRAKLDILKRACDQRGRPYEEVLRSYIAVIVVAADETRLQTKLARLFPPAFLEARQGTGYIMTGTPERMLGYLRGLAEAGIQYIVVQLADTADIETLELLASEVIPHVNGPHRSHAVDNPIEGQVTSAMTVKPMS